MNEAIERFGFRKQVFLTDLSYSEFNKKIENDTISESDLKEEGIVYENNNESDKTEQIDWNNDFNSDFKLISLFVLSLAFPIRYLIILLKWSLREVKN